MSSQSNIEGPIQSPKKPLGTGGSAKTTTYQDYHSIQSFPTLIFQVKTDYNYSLSSEENYSSNEKIFVGKYSYERSLLDYTYHHYYIEERQLLHDRIIDMFLRTRVFDSVANITCETPLENWIVFTAGVMGAGKGHTIQFLHNEGLFPKDAFVNVDPDIFRSLLPEFEQYNRLDSNTAGYLTQKEVGYISEVLSYHALEKGKNVLIDGSLRNAHWYKEYFRNLRETFPKIRVAILFVDAKIDTILDRARSRAKVTGRIVPEDVIISTAQEIPISMKILKSEADFYCELVNENGIPIYARVSEMRRKVVIRERAFSCPDNINAVLNAAAGTAADTDKISASSSGKVAPEKTNGSSRPTSAQTDLDLKAPSGTTSRPQSAAPRPMSARANPSVLNNSATYKDTSSPPLSPAPNYRMKLSWTMEHIHENHYQLMEYDDEEEFSPTSMKRLVKSATNHSDNNSLYRPKVVTELTTWKDYFQDIWTMRCALPLYWMPAVEEVNHYSKQSMESKPTDERR